MKEKEYFKRAATDAAFRKAQIQEQRDFISMGKVLFWMLGAPLLAFSLYLAFTSERESITSILLTFVVFACIHGEGKTTIAALEALEDPKPSPGSEEMSAASAQR